jgi:signal transduction histidine kinase
MRLDWEPPEDPLIVYGDADLLKIVVINLLSNAAKYGFQQGRIELSVELTDGILRFSVFNEGPGWPESEQPRLFKKFTRLQTEELQRRKGTGVGLYTCWRIARLHGGRIFAESKHGEWARFTCEIPQPLAQPLPTEIHDTDSVIEQPR